MLIDLLICLLDTFDRFFFHCEGSNFSDYKPQITTNCHVKLYISNVGITEHRYNKICNLSLKEPLVLKNCFSYALE